MRLASWLALHFLPGERDAWLPERTFQEMSQSLPREEECW